MSRQRNKTRNKRPVQKQQPITTQQQNHQQVVQVTEQFSGPIPPPDVLERYNQIAPGAANRIIAMAEQETGHRRDMELSILSNEYREARMGQICAVIIGSLAIITGGITAVSGAQWAGLAIGGCGVVGLVSVFIFGRKGIWRQQRDKPA